MIPRMTSLASQELKLPEGNAPNGVFPSDIVLPPLDGGAFVDTLLIYQCLHPVAG